MTKLVKILMCAAVVTLMNGCHTVDQLGKINDTTRESVKEVSNTVPALVEDGLSLYDRAAGLVRRLGNIFGSGGSTNKPTAAVMFTPTDTLASQ